MKYSNEDMDDLFRRAAERYPLRTDSADWDRLAGALDGQPELPPGEDEKRRRRGIFWWLLLIPLAGIGYLTWQGRGQHASDKVVTTAPAVGTQTGKDVNAAATASAGVAGAKDDAAASKTGTGNAKAGAGNPNVEVATPNATGIAKAGVENTNPGTGGHSATDAGANTRPADASGRTSGANTRTADASGRTGGANTRTADASRRNFDAGRLTAGTGRQTAPGRTERANEAGGANLRTTSVGGKDGAGASGNGVVKTNTTGRGRRNGQSGGGRDFAGVSGENGPDAGGTSTFEKIQPGFAMFDLGRAPIGSRDGINVDVTAPETAVNGVENKGGKKSDPAAAAKRTPHFYAGLSAAPDFSTVHFQSMKGIGTTFGVLLGYSLNKRWAIETGLYLDRKRYYTQGEYFSTKNVRLYPGSKLLNVDGTCYMWEIPVNIRYNLSVGHKMTWFATTGLSTYLMSRESYNYAYWNGWATEDSYWNIHKASQYWFSIWNLSAGFEQHIGKVGNLRLEPYVRVPLSGIGTGSLPILSGGVNIGLTHRF